MPVDLVSVGVVCADVMARPVEEMPARGTLGLVPVLEMHLGGLAAVTASVYSQLGGKSAFLGRVGADGFGDYLLASLQQKGVDTRLVPRGPASRSSATVVMIDEAGERTFLHHTGANGRTCASDIDFSKIAHMNAKALHWGGPSIMPGLDGAPMGRVFAEARAQGLRTTMDTCYDGIGVWLPLIEDSLPHLDLIFSSYEEACCYTGENEVEAIADFYLNYGIGTAVIKLGDQGVFIKSTDEEYRIAAHKVNVLDTTGAGDAFCGGFLYGWLQSWDLERCGRLANAVGALTVQHMGGADAIRDLEQVLTIMETLS